jgi:tetratricopeptide (TPR) repeat protein
MNRLIDHRNPFFSCALRWSFATTFFLFLCLLLGSGCYRVPDKIEPRVSYQLQDQHLQGLSSAFPALSWEERQAEWGREYTIAHAFAKELDLYRAVSTFKRAQILLPQKEELRKDEIAYDILFCLFLGKKYDEAIEAFEHSTLAHVDKTFPAYHDLLLILYECYEEMEDPSKQQRILELFQKNYPASAEKLQVSQALRQADLPQLQELAEGFHGPSYLSKLLDTYYLDKKSIPKAQAFNAILPGLGYLYIGQTQSAITAFILNGLFIAAAYQFFHQGHTAAGIITTGFEAGWYFGGIYGAGEETKYYNERLYEKNAGAVLNEQKLFPVLMLEHTF